MPIVVDDLGTGFALENEHSAVKSKDRLLNRYGCYSDGEPTVVGVQDVLNSDGRLVAVVLGGEWKMGDVQTVQL